MDRSERFYLIRQLLACRRSVTTQQFLEALEIPYADHRELLMDILKHGRHCEVPAPATLREVVVGELEGMLEKYR